MPRYWFERGPQGGLGIQHQDGWSLFLWADEVKRLTELLGRPTPAIDGVVTLSRPMGLQVQAVHFASGKLTLRLPSTVDGSLRADLDHEDTMALRHTLGLLEPRGSEPYVAVLASSLETWGPAADRRIIIAGRGRAGRTRASAIVAARQRAEESR
jgi:hypothetical protein